MPRGIVYGLFSKKVIYKFDTMTLPKLNAGEEIKQREDIDSIAVDAIYNDIADSYVNPVIVPPPDLKAQFAAASTTQDKITVLAKALYLI